MEIFQGILLVCVSGLGTGTFMWPLRWMHNFKFEHFWFIAMLSGLLVTPWVATSLLCPDMISAYKSVDSVVLLKANLFAVFWGIANILYGICVVRIGAALTGAILSALGASIGVLIPMVFKASGLFKDSPGINSPAGIIVTCGVAVVVIGLVIITFAGFGRDKVLKIAAQEKQGFLGGLIMVIIAGILSCGISFTFVYSQGPIVEAMKAHGAADIGANFAVWAIGLTGGALINILYPCYLMTKNKSWGVLSAHWKEIPLAVIIGIQFIIAVTLLGKGMILLGAIGASVGFGIQQAMQIIGNQLVGLLRDEWKGVYGRPRTLMYIAICILLIAGIIMACGKSLV